MPLRSSISTGAANRLSTGFALTKRAMPNRSSIRNGGAATLDEAQVVRRHCTVCDWEAELVERGRPEAPLCPCCFALTARTAVVGVIVPERGAGEKNVSATSLGR